MRHKSEPIWPVLVTIVGAASLALAYFFWDRDKPSGNESLRLPPALVVPQETPAAPPAIEHPIEEAEVATTPAAIEAPEQAPPSADAGTFETALAELIGQAAFSDFVIGDALVEHLVVTIDNLPQEKLVRRLVPIRPVSGPVAVSGGVGKPVWDEANHARYAPYIALLQRLDLKRLASAYVHHYAAFQQAYDALGYPDAYFNDRVVAVIDHLLATPDLATPFELVQPKVMYRFADPALESRSAGQKVLLRMGSANAAIVKERLRELRQLITASRPP